MVIDLGKRPTKAVVRCNSVSALPSIGNASMAVFPSLERLVLFLLLLSVAFSPSHPFRMASKNTEDIESKSCKNSFISTFDDDSHVLINHPSGALKIVSFVRPRVTIVPEPTYQLGYIPPGQTVRGCLPRGSSALSREGFIESTSEALSFPKTAQVNLAPAVCRGRPS